MSDRKASSAVIQKEEWHILKARNYLALLLAMLLCTSAAYAASPFDDSLSDSPDAQKVLALQGMIVYNIGDKLDAAVKLYKQDKDSLLDAIQNGTLGEIPAEISQDPHLHFALSRDGKAVDPAVLLPDLA